MNIGFIGLGNMGSGMAKNLHSAGFSVIAFDTDESKLTTLHTSGILAVKSVSEVAEKCKVVIVCLPNPNASREVVLNQLAENNNVATIIETSTLTPEIVGGFANQLSESGKHFVSAPMIGGKNQAASGDIEFLIEGNEKAYKQNVHIFETMGKARFMGGVPSATLAKLTFNLCRYANLAVAVESYRLLQRYGANTVAIHEFMSEQSLDNFGQVWAEDMKDTMTKGIPFKPSQVPKKDLALLSDMSKSQGINQRLVDAIRDTYLSME